MSGSLKLDLAQYREVAAFAQFGSDLDAATQNMLNRGEKLTELLNQKQYVPIPVEEQVCILYAGVKGHLDKVATSDMAEFEAKFREHIRSKHLHLYTTIREDSVLSEKSEAELKSIIKDFLPNSGLKIKS